MVFSQCFTDSLEMAWRSSLSFLFASSRICSSLYRERLFWMRLHESGWRTVTYNYKVAQFFSHALL